MNIIKTLTDITLDVLPVTGLIRAIKRSNEDCESNYKSALVCAHIFYNTLLFGYAGIEIRDYFFKPVQTIQQETIT